MNLYKFYYHIIYLNFILHLSLCLLVFILLYCVMLYFNIKPIDNKIIEDLSI